jgi:hypothetical protein
MIIMLAIMHVNKLPFHFRAFLLRSHVVAMSLFRLLMYVLLAPTKH